MIGQVVHANSRFTAGQLISLSLAVALIVIAVLTKNVHWAMPAVFPFCLALGLRFAQPRSCSFSLEETGIRLMNRNQTIAYDSIHRILVNDKLADLAHTNAIGEIAIQYDVSHIIRLPSDTSVPIKELTEFIQSRIPVRAVKLPPPLDQYYARVTEKFGESQIRVFQQVGRDFPSKLRRQARTFFGAWVFTAAIWIGISIAVPAFAENWRPAGIMVLIFSSLALLGISLVRNTKLKHSGIVTSPLGLALKQGEIQGELRWDELLKFKRVPNNGVLRIFVEASHIDVQNVYDRSLNELEWAIREAKRH